MPGLWLYSIKYTISYEIRIRTKSHCRLIEEQTLILYIFKWLSLFKNNTLQNKIRLCRKNIKKGIGDWYKKHKETSKKVQMSRKSTNWGRVMGNLYKTIVSTYRIYKMFPV